MVNYNDPILTQFPASPAIPTRTVRTQRFDQVMRMGLQLYGTPFASQAALMLKANWDSLIAATDATRMIISPPFSNFKLTPSKPIMTNPDSNATISGVPIHFSEGTAEMSGEFLDTEQAVINAFFAVVAPFSESTNGVNVNSLVSYWCNKDGMLFSNPTWGGFQLLSFQKRTRGGNGLNSSDIVGFTGYLVPNWDTVTPPIPTVPAGAGAVDLRAYNW
jgi:hypothetical protein